MTTATAVRRQPVHVPAWWRDAVWVTVCVRAVVVVGLWVSGHGEADLSSWPAAGLTSLGRITGLLSADLLLVQVLLMARLPALERTYGQDKLAHTHRLVGFWSFSLLLAHTVLITLGYSSTDKKGIVREAWDLVTTYGGMLLATASLVALSVVTVTSIRRARRRLRYESWHLLHLYAYLGVGLAIPHQIWTGKDLMSSHLAEVYWVGSYVVAAGSLLAYRVVVPVWRSAQAGLRVADVVRETRDVVTVRMTGRHLHRLQVQAGQFFVFRFLDGPGWTRGNPYSLSAAPRPDQIQITAKDLGDGSGRLSKLKRGTRVLVEGPYGRLTAVGRTRKKLAMLASGIGITPLCALLEELPYDHGDATLVYRGREAHDLVFQRRIDDLALTRGITVHRLTGRRIRARHSWLPEDAAKWRDTDALLHLVPDLADRDVYVCGPDEWTSAICRAAIDAGLPPSQLHRERFAW